MKKTILFSILSGLLMTLAGAANAAIVTQNNDFSFQSTAYDGQNTSQVTLVEDGAFSAICNPFDDSLGTLNKFTIEWTLDLSATFQVDSSDNNGDGATISAGGTFYIGDIAYSSGGGGDSNGGLSGTYSLSFLVEDTNAFLVSDAGETYNPAILSLVSGSDTFYVLWDSDFVCTYLGEDVSQFIGLATGGVSLTYDYTPNSSTVPVPSSIILFGFGLIGVAAWNKKTQTS